jgi:hypothetical protein
LVSEPKVKKSCGSLEVFYSLKKKKEEGRPKEKQPTGLERKEKRENRSRNPTEDSRREGKPIDATVVEIGAVLEIEFRIHKLNSETEFAGFNLFWVKVNLCLWQ